MTKKAMGIRYWWLGIGALSVLIVTALVVTKQPVFFPHASTPPSVDEQHLKNLVRILSTEFSHRNIQHPIEMEGASKFIAKELGVFSSRVTFQKFSSHGAVFSNVSALFGPSTGERIIVGAHYDNAGGKGAGEIVPGADDNASGIAGIVELAHLFSLHPPKVPVELVAFALEEAMPLGLDLIGSEVHAIHLRDKNVAVSLMIDLEMIGYFSDAPNSQKYHMSILQALYPSTANFIALVGRWNEWKRIGALKSAMIGATDLPVSSLSMPYALPRLADSDHVSYWRAGFPAVMITDTSFNRNGNYHTQHDTWDTLDYQRMGKVIQGVFAYIVAER